MQKIKKYTKENILLILLITLSIFSHWFIFLDFKFLNSGDWIYLPDQMLKDLISYGEWSQHTNFGVVMIMASNLSYFWLASLIHHIFPIITWDIFTRIFFLTPITVLIPYFSFSFFNKVFSNKLLAFFAASLYTFNTFVLKLQLDWITYAYVWWIFPAIFYYILEYFDTEKERHLVYIALLSCLGIIYEVRIFLLCLIYIFSFILYSFIIKINKNNFLKIIKIFTAVFVGILMQMFWILPFGFTTISSDVLGAASISPFASFYSMIDAITLHSYVWTGNLVLEPFIRQNIPIQLYLVPLISIIGIYISLKLKKENMRIYSYFFSITLLISLFLSKQGFSPFPEIYGWLFKHLPLFNLYRESSKFFILVSISLSYFFALGLYYIYKKISKYSKKISSLVVYLILFFGIFYNLQHFFDQKIGGMTKGIEISSEYIELEKFILDKNESARILYIPRKPRFGYFSKNNPFVNETDFIKAIEQLVGFSLYDGSLPIENQIMMPLLQNYSNFLFSISQIKYVILPNEEYRDRIISLEEKEEISEPFYNYGGGLNKNIRTWYLDTINSVPFLKKIKVPGTNLDVYENENYRPYFDSITTLIKFDTFQNLNGKYSFLLDKYENNIDFYVDNSSSTIPSKTLTLLYENNDFSTIQNNTLVENHMVNSGTNLYVNTSPATTFFVPGNNIYTIMRKDVTNLLINTTPLQNNQEENIYSSSSAIWPTYIKVGSEIIETNRNDLSVILLGSSNKKIELFKKSEDTVIPNGSFEDGLWNQEVGDCNNYDDYGKVSERLATSSYSGRQSLELEATRHTACTGVQNIPVNEEDQYLFSFVYRSSNAKSAGYYISMSGATTTIISERLSVSGTDWNKYHKLIQIPKKVKNISLLLYTYEDDGEEPIKIYYDDVRLEKVLTITTIDPSRKDTFIPINESLSKINTFIAADSNIRLENIITNPDFNDGLWSKTVGDCNNYDGNGALAQRLIKDTRDNGNSLELEVTRHTACTGTQLIPVNEGMTYLLSFEYQSNDSSEVGYHIGWVGTSTRVINERIPIKDNKWHTYTKNITVPLGVTGAGLSVYAYENDKITAVKVHYDNFHLIKLPEINNKYYLFNDSDLNFIKPEEITFDHINPTKKLVHIHGATTPFYLTMSEAYHPQWQLEFNNTKVNGFFKSWIPWVHPDVVSGDNYFKLDGFLNGWYVDTAKLCLDEQGNLRDGCNRNEDGSYDMEMIIEFTPQRWFYIGLLISGTTLISCILYLLFPTIRTLYNYTGRKLKSAAKKMEVV